jgi:hypothetical protein
MWVQRYVNPEFTQHHYLEVQVGGIIGGLLLVMLVARWLKPWFIFLYLSLFILPSMLFNIVFHRFEAWACSIH